MKQINKTCIRLLSLLMLFLFTGIGNVWADDLVELYSADFDQTGDTHAGNSNSYSDHTYSASGVNWTIAYSEICNPSAAISGYSCIGRVAKKTTNSPTMTTGAISVAGNTVKKISFDVKGATTITVKCYTSTTGANNDWSELYSGSATSTKSTVTKENLTIACPIYLKFVGSVSSSNNARDFAIDNVKVEGISASATLSATPATIDFGTVEQGATVEAKAVAVSFANLTSASVSAAISNSAELATPAFSVSPASLTESGNVTITPSTATVGNYTETLTLTAADGSKTATVTVKMNVEAPFNGKKVAFSFTSAVSGWKTSKNDAAVGNYTYTIGEEPNQETYTFYQTKESDGIYCSSGYLMINSGNALGLPAVEGHKLVKVVATNSNTCSNATKIAIKDGTGENATAVGAEQTWSTTNSTYTYDLTGTAVNTMYYLCVSNKNCQLTGLTLFYEAVALNEITVKTAPAKVVYTAGELFAPAGLVITATYTDGTQKDVAYADAASDFSFAPSLTTALTTENDKVVITYGGKSVNQTITVNEATGYTVMIDEDIENGSVTAEPMTNLAEGDEVTLTATPNPGYKFVKWDVLGDDEMEVGADNKFRMPASDVLVSATFAPKTAESIELNATTKSMAIGETFQLTATVAPNDLLDEQKTVTWTSSNTEVATVAGGLVRAVAAGTATITAKAGDVEETCTITIADAYVLTFGTGEDDKYTSSLQNYTSTWSHTAYGVTYSITAFSNNQKNWQSIKAGCKDNTASTASITTPKFTKPINSVVITFGSVATDKVNSAKLYVSNSTDFSGVTGIDFTVAQGDVTIPITNKSKDCYYKIELDLQGSNKNGFIEITKVVFFADELAKSAVTFTDVYGEIGVLTIYKDKPAEVTTGEDITEGTELLVEAITIDNDYVVSVLVTNTATGADVTAEVFDAETGILTMPNYAITVSANFVEGVQKPVFDPEDGTFTEEQLIKISCSTTGATIYYNINSEDDPTNVSTPYDENEGITLDSRGTYTIKAIAYKGENYSTIATATYTLNLPYSIADFITEKPAGNVNVDLTGAVVLGVTNNNNIYLQKGDATLLLYKSDGLTITGAATGKQLFGTINGAHYVNNGAISTYNGIAEMVVNYHNVSVGDGTLPEATEITIPTEGDENCGKYVVVKNVYFQAEKLKSNKVTISDGTNTCAMLNTFSGTESANVVNKVFPQATTPCEVKGVWVHANGEYRILPIDNVTCINTNNAKAPLPTLSPAGSVDEENPKKVAAGTVITITPAANTTTLYMDDFETLDDVEIAATGKTITLADGDLNMIITAIRDYYQNNVVEYHYTVDASLTAHAITLTQPIGGTIAAKNAENNDAPTAVNGDVITLTATPAAHYSFGEWAVIYNDGEEKTITPDKNNQFTMPAYDVMVSATFNEDAKYSVTFANGAATATGDAPTMDAQYEDEQITLPANTFTYTGHKFTGWNDGNNTYAAGATYTMPAAAVTFTAQWEELSSWAYVYTSNVTMEGEGNNYAGNVKYGEEGTEYAGKRAGKKDGAGSVKVTIPANATALHFHAAAWSGDNVTLIVKDGDNVILSQKLESDGGIQGNGTTYPLDNDLFTYYYSISFSPTLLEEKEIVFTTNSSSEKTYRFVLFGVNAEVTTLDVAENETISENASYGNVIIEAGKALTVNAALTVTGNLVLQAKDDNKPEVVLNGDVTATNMYYEWTVATNSNNVFALPCNVAWADIEYWNGTAWDDNFNLFITTYNGQSRAEYGVADEEQHNWRYLPATEALQANVGYILYVPAGQVNNLTEVTLRFKLSDAALSRAPRTYSTTAYTATNGEGNAADAGWNYVGNPLLQSYASSVGDVKYATIPNLAGTAYTQGPVTSNVLKPFTPFFVQVEGAKTLTFSLNAPAAMPALYRVENEQAELFAEVTLDNERTGLWMADKYTTAYEINADLVKMFGENTTTVYTVSGNTRLAYNALPDAAAEAIPVGFSALAGEHTFSLAEGYSDGFEQLNLIDHVAGAVIDLLSTDYTFTLTENESMNETRFELNAVRADAAGQTTGIEAVGHELLNEGVYKLLIDGKVYIIRNGVWYDVTGRMVK